MPDVIDLLREHLPDLDWTGKFEGMELASIEAKVGQDWARGPWLKFNYKMDDAGGSVQGYWLYTGGERIKIDGNIEVSDDDMRLSTEGGRVIVQFSSKFEKGPHTGETFRYEFVGKM